jgi:hypothetical protein
MTHKALLRIFYAETSAGFSCLCHLEGRKTCLHLADRLPPVSLEISYCELQPVTHIYSLFLLPLATVVLLSRQIQSILYVPAVYCLITLALWWDKLSSNHLKQPYSNYALVQIQLFLTPSQVPSLNITFIHYSTLLDIDLFSSLTFYLGEDSNNLKLRQFTEA